MGHTKCGVMLFGTARENANDQGREWILQGKPISIVEEYTYLGVKITPDLNELEMMNARIGNEDGDDCGYSKAIPMQLQNSGTVESQGT